MRRYLLILLLYPALVHAQDSITVKVPVGDPTGIAPMGTRFMSLAQPSAIRYIKINADNTISLRTAAESLTDIGAQASGTYLAPDGNGSALTGLTKSQVGLSNVDNTTDAGKPVSTSQQTALNLKANLASPTFTGTVSGVTATMVGLGSVSNNAQLTIANNLSDLNNAATARTNIGLGNVTNESKATMFTSPTFTGTTSGITATMVGLGNVTNESKATMFTSPTFTGHPVIEGVTSTGATGTGKIVYDGSPTLVTPALGTPASGNLANCTFPTLNQNTTGTAGGLSADIAESRVTNLVSDLAAKAPLASPAFTGTPTGIGIPVYGRVTGSNATTTGQSLVDIAGLTVALAINATYEFEAVLSVSTTAVTTGTQYGINYSVAGGAIEAGVNGPLTSTASKAERITALNTATSAYLTTSAQTGQVVIKGIVTTAGNAGNLTVKHLKVTSGTSTIFINSYLKVTRIL